MAHASIRHWPFGQKTLPLRCALNLDQLVGMDQIYPVVITGVMLCAGMFTSDVFLAP